MNANEANCANRATLMARAEAQTKIRTQRIAAIMQHPEFANARARAKIDEALASIRSVVGDHGSAGYSAGHYLHVEARPPRLEHFAAIYGEAHGIADQLRALGYTCEIPEPHRTHDYDGHNGVTCVISISFADPMPHGALRPSPEPSRAEQLGIGYGMGGSELAR